ncbi:hypothetical protein CVU75_00245 [Candidatus Dependentiae bacterium HGW-Dependentiae-1]|nr:MAG: hypothetical protein CVU75_00245 [Candidatus Dependentiae bacterium HGW-Dependentiae-1]
MNCQAMRIKLFLFLGVVFFGNRCCAMEMLAKQSLPGKNEQEVRMNILSGVRDSLAAIAIGEETFYKDRPKGQEQGPCFQDLRAAVTDNAPLVYNTFVATISIGSLLLFYHIRSKQVTYIYPTQSPVHTLSIDEHGSLLVQLTSGKKEVWQLRRPRSIISAHCFDWIVVAFAEPVF